MNRWLLVRGRGDRPLDRRVRPEEIVGVPEHDPERSRWAWRFPVRPLVVVRDLDRAPAAEEAGIFPQSLWRHSYIRLTDEQFDTARALIEEAASRT